MSRTTLSITESVSDYLLSVSLREADVLRELRDETASHPNANMQISPEQGQFMQMLVRLIGAKKVVEVGVFTGYSSLAVALALPETGRIVACDVSEEYTSIARRYWEKAEIADKVDLRLAPAVETLDHLLKHDQGAETFDMAFIDADKESYLLYYERILKLLRPGGLMLVDNVLWSGLPADPEHHDSNTDAIREFNAFLFQDERIDLSLLPLADGLTLARKR
ncbi:MAG: class I SAM-dependent methyltransferase [Proteobacteria bacterium]|jgi:caffeoyl-CoA O-methyltransferase|nr:class I SAM-dependent methyltransferase [Pseudomonadota bacterium]MBT5794511.1 SAM-dependent methyltransferase [Deltaproteobacteria bacterium]